MIGMPQNINVGMGVKRKTTPLPPQFVSRVRIDNTLPNVTNVIVPVNAFFAFSVGLGSGGAWQDAVSVSQTYPNWAASGGELMKGWFSVFPGETLTAAVSPTINNQPFATSLARGASNLILAQNGVAATTTVLYAPGTNGTKIRDDDIVRNSPNAASGGFGGTSGSDQSDLDTLGCWGVPPFSNGVNVTPAMGYGQGAVRFGGSTLVRHSGGVLWIEFYTADPRGKTI